METTQLLKQRAEQGNVDALFRLGYRLAFGRHRPRPTDWHAAFEYWEQAACGGYARAMFYLGTCCEQGNGTAQDMAQAMQWYEKAAQQGHLAAMFNLAFSYRTGDGVPQDDERMRFWLVKAAERGDPDSQRDLGWCYHEGVGFPQDFAQAVRWYRAAARQGDRKAQFNLGYPIWQARECRYRYAGDATGWKRQPDRGIDKQRRNCVNWIICDEIRCERHRLLPYCGLGSATTNDCAHRPFLRLAAAF